MLPLHLGKEMKAGLNGPVSLSAISLGTRLRGQGLTAALGGHGVPSAEERGSE